MKDRIIKKEEYENQGKGSQSILAQAFESAESGKEKSPLIWKMVKNKGREGGESWPLEEGGKRWVCPLGGNLILSFAKQSTQCLEPGKIQCLDGGQSVNVLDEIEDYQLIVQEGAQGRMTFLTFQETAREMMENPLDRGEKVQGLFVEQGYAVVVVDGREILVREGEQLIMEELTCHEKIRIMGQGQGIFTTVDFIREDLFIEEIAPEKATGEDFLWAMKIAHTNFRASGYLIKSLRKNWYDPPLKKAIHRLERFYLPFLIGLLGLSLVSLGWMKIYGSEKILFPILGWLLLDIFFITPLLYFLFLPKPIKKHIKPVDQLNGAEKKRYQEEQQENQRTGWLLKKYKITGRNKYTDD